MVVLNAAGGPVLYPSFLLMLIWGGNGGNGARRDADQTDRLNLKAFESVRLGRYYESFHRVLPYFTYVISVRLHIQPPSETKSKTEKNICQ